MLPRSKRVLAVFIIACLLTAFWCLYFPYDEEALFTPIPWRTPFISVHDRIGDRWELLAGGGLGRTVAAMTGEEDPSVYLASDYRRAARFFLGRKTCFAYVPEHQFTGREGWVFTTWAGSSSQLLRWGILPMMLDDMKGRRLPGQTRTPYWVYGTGRDRIVMALRGGVLVGVFGGDLGLLKEMLDNMDRAERGKGSICQVRLKNSHEIYPDSMDVAWCRIPTEYSSDNACLMSLTPMDAGMVADLSLSKTLPAEGSVAASASDAAKVGGQYLDGVSVMKWAALRKWIMDTDDSATNSLTIDFIDHICADEGDFFLGIMNDNFSSTIQKLKVPVFLMGIEVKERLDVMTEVSGLMDRLNAEKGLGVIPMKIPTEGEPIIIAGGSKMNMFGSVKERPAVTVIGDWLVLATDFQSLQQVIGTVQDSDAVEQPRWERLMMEMEGSAGLYIDFQAAEQAIRNAIAVYTLSVYEAKQEKSAERRRLDAARAFVGAMAEVGEVTASAVIRESRLGVRIEVKSGEGL